MHIAEGVLSGPVLAAGWGVTAVGAGLGLRALDENRLMTVALLAAAFFVASLIHVPIGPSAVHLILNGLLGAILGLAAFPAILVGLTLQALLFQFGGLTALGVNTMNMALPPALLAMALRPFLLRQGATRAVAAFAIGAGAVAGSAVLTALSLALSGEALIPAAKMILLAHLPIMAIEGVVTVFVVGFVARVRPEMFTALLTPGTSRTGSESRP